MKLSLEVTGTLAFCGYLVILLLRLRLGLLAQLPNSMFSTSMPFAASSHSHEDEALWSCHLLYNITGLHLIPTTKTWVTLFIKTTSVEPVSYSLQNENSQVPVWFPFIPPLFLKNAGRCILEWLFLTLDLLQLYLFKGKVKGERKPTPTKSHSTNIISHNNETL